VVASAQPIVEGEVRELVRRRKLDPVLERQATRRLVDMVLSDYLDRAAMSALPPLGDTAAAGRTVFDEVASFGALQRYLNALAA
jgi:pilus assembly protein CpaF